MKGKTDLKAGECRVGGQTHNPNETLVRDAAMNHNTKDTTRNLNLAVSFFAFAAVVAATTTLRAQDKAPSKYGQQQAADATKPSEAGRKRIVRTDDGYEVTYEPFQGTDFYVEVSRRKLPDWQPQRQSRTHVAVPALIVLAGLGLGSLLFWAKYRHDKRAIIREMQKRHGSVEHLRSRIGWFLSEWEVTYLDEQGVRRRGMCHVQPGWGWSVYWKNQDPS
jgi:hypothetical protein